MVRWLAVAALWRGVAAMGSPCFLQPPVSRSKDQRSFFSVRRRRRCRLPEPRVRRDVLKRRTALASLSKTQQDIVIGRNMKLASSSKLPHIITRFLPTYFPTPATNQRARTPHSPLPPPLLPFVRRPPFDQIIAQGQMGENQR